MICGLKFGKTGTSKLGTLTNCNFCKKQFVYKHKNDRIDCCQVCMNRHARRAAKLKFLEYKGGKCEICGYNKSPKALVFHHLNPLEKEFTISGFLTRNFNSVKKELDKCQLLCCNCHAEQHEILDSLGH